MVDNMSASNFQCTSYKNLVHQTPTLHHFLYKTEPISHFYWNLIELFLKNCSWKIQGCITTSQKYPLRVAMVYQYKVHTISNYTLLFTIHISVKNIGFVDEIMERDKTKYSNHTLAELLDG